MNKNIRKPRVRTNRSSSIDSGNGGSMWATNRSKLVEKYAFVSTDNVWSCHAHIAQQNHGSQWQCGTVPHCTQ